MLSVKALLQKTIELIAEARLTGDEVICVDATKFKTTVLVHTEALIRIFHKFRVARKDVQARACQQSEFIHVSFPARGIVFCAMVDNKETAKFLESHIRQLPAPRAKRLGVSSQRRLSFVPDEVQR